MEAEESSKELSELQDIVKKQKAEIDELNEKHQKELAETRNSAEKNKAEADKANEMLKQREQALQQMSSQYADLYQQFSEVDHIYTCVLLKGLTGKASRDIYR